MEQLLEIEQHTGCQKPCRYLEYRLVYIRYHCWRPSPSSFLQMIYTQGEREVIPADSERALPVPTETCLRLHFRWEGGAHLPLDLPRRRGAGHHHHGPGHHGHGHGCPGHGHHIHLLCQPSSSPWRCLYHFFGALLRWKAPSVSSSASLSSPSGMDAITFSPSTIQLLSKHFSFENDLLFENISSLKMISYLKTLLLWKHRSYGYIFTMKMHMINFFTWRFGEGWGIVLYEKILKGEDSQTL